MDKRPYQYLPMDLPRNYDPGPKFFYDNFVKKFIPDMIQMMDTGLTINSEAVDSLRLVIDSVLHDVGVKLQNNRLINKFLQHRLPAAQKAHAKKATQSVRTAEHYMCEFKSKDMQHRVFVVNSYLESIHQSMDIRDKWTFKDLKQYNIWLKDPFINALAQNRDLKTNSRVIKFMAEFAQHKADIWNKPRYQKAKEPVPTQPFNPGSNKQVKEFFEMLKIAPITTSKDTGEASWGREQIEEIRANTSNEELLEVLDAMIDYSYSAIIRSNFLKAFDSFTIDGVLHGNIKLFGAKSFRNTSNSPNLLNAPSTGSIYAKPLKRCFVAPEGYVIYTADLAALEDRVIANLSGDKNKLSVFLEGLDGHSLNSCSYFTDSIQKIINTDLTGKELVKLFMQHLTEGNLELKKIRQNSKAPTFKLSYGGFPDSDRGGVITPEIFDNYHNVLYPGITKYREEYVLTSTKKNGFIHLGLGCRMYSSDPDTDIRTLNNATVQFWSILTLIAINEFNHRIRQAGFEQHIQVISTIYDSIYVQVINNPDIVKWVNDNLIELMCVEYIQNEIVHNEASGEIGYNWADLKPIPNNASTEEIKSILTTL